MTLMVRRAQLKLRLSHHPFNIMFVSAHHTLRHLVQCHESEQERLLIKLERIIISLMMAIAAGTAAAAAASTPAAVTVFGSGRGPAVAVGEEGRHLAFGVNAAAFGAHCHRVGIIEAAHQFKIIMTIKALIFINRH
jgi:hypothetical protein